MNITRSLQKWGNGTGIRIPKEVMDAASLTLNQPLEVSLKGKSIVLTPVDADKEFTLVSMLKGVTPETAHSLDEWGPDLGAEVIDAYSQ